MNIGIEPIGCVQKFHDENIYVMNADGSDLIRITDDPASDALPVWSPDSTKIAYISGDLSKSDADLYLVDSNGQNHRHLTHHASKSALWEVEWSPDGQFIFFDMGQQTVKIDVNDGKTTPITPSTDVNIPSDFALSEDGSKLLYLAATCAGQDPGSSGLCYTAKTMNVDGSNEQTLGTMNFAEVCRQTDSWMGSFTRWSPDRTK